MFTKKPDRKDSGQAIRPETRATESSLKPPILPRDAADSPPTVPASHRQSSVIGDELRVVGSVSSDGELRVEGTIEGDIRCSCLVINPTARIVGDVMAEDVIVNGRLHGDIRGLRVTLQTHADVEGDIYHQSLAIEDGACFEGSSRRSEEPFGGKDKLESAGPAGTKGTPSKGANGESPKPSEPARDKPQGSVSEERESEIEGAS